MKASNCQLGTFSKVFDIGADLFCTATFFCPDKTFGVSFDITLKGGLNQVQCLAD